VTQPAVAEFLELAAGRDLQLEMEETHIKAGSALIGVELRNSGLRKDLDLIVLAIRRAGGEMLFNPKAETVLATGDTLIAMGPGTCLAKLHERAGDRVSWYPQRLTRHDRPPRSSRFMLRVPIGAR
jgi:voltage-gated potassium channel